MAFPRPTGLRSGRFDRFWTAWDGFASISPRWSTLSSRRNGTGFLAPAARLSGAAARYMPARPRRGQRTAGAKPGGPDPLERRGADAFGSLGGADGRLMPLLTLPAPAPARRRYAGGERH